MNEAVIRQFVKENRFAERLQLDAELVLEVLINSISEDIGIGRSYHRAAEMALLLLDGIAVDKHREDNVKFDLVYSFERVLEEAIVKAYSNKM